MSKVVTLHYAYDELKYCKLFEDTMRKSNLVIIIILAIAGGYAYFKFNGMSEYKNDDIDIVKKNKEVQKKSQKKADHDGHALHTMTPSPAKGPSSASKSTKNTDKSITTKISEIDNFSYASEVEMVRNLAKDYPNSRSKLVEILSKPDPFKEHQLEVLPHSGLEETQNKMGTIKVLALRTILEKEKDPKLLISTLTKISQNANDPTIQAIAKASLESAQAGRSFVKDFVDGVSNQEIPD